MAPLLALAFLALACLPPGHGSAVDMDAERLIGWRGEVSMPTSQDSSLQRSSQQSMPSSASRGWVETLTWYPRSFLYHGFLSPEECDHLMSLVKSNLQRSEVVSDKSDERIDKARTSYSASLGDHSHDPVVSAVEQRIADWTHLPRSHGEPIEVLRYQNGQKYDAHWDWFEDKFVDEQSGNRVATVLMYLSDVLEGAGGETAMPLAHPLHEDGASPSVMLDTERGGIKIKPRKGDALLFWDALPDGKTPDRLTLHASCPTNKGQKWTATRWIHSRPYSPE